MHLLLAIQIMEPRMNAYCRAIHSGQRWKSGRASYPFVFMLWVFAPIYCFFHWRWMMFRMHGVSGTLEIIRARFF